VRDHDSLYEPVDHTEPNQLHQLFQSYSHPMSLLSYQHLISTDNTLNQSKESFDLLMSEESGDQATLIGDWYTGTGRGDRTVRRW